MVGTQTASSLLKDFSLEMTGKDVAHLQDARHVIPQGTRINVTFLGNETARHRLRAAEAAKRYGFQPVPHISARRLRSRSALEQFLAGLQSLDSTEHVFAVGGDPVTPEGPYESALALIDTGLLGKYGVRNVSISGYPEGHPSIPTSQLWAALEHKCAALDAQGLAGTIITQFGFDVDRTVAWLEHLRASGIDLPVRIGVPGPVGVRRLLAYARRFGVSTSASITMKYGFSLTNLLGTAGPHDFIAELAQHAATRKCGEVLLHFYTFGGLGTTARWVRDFEATS